ncbi:hypothetical protein C8J57DRAFT_679329 [Mycena rebaudengoi]|nr:hypothetical protein C8J57DRAFT_679329 [Mycena rebaudengoi]
MSQNSAEAKCLTPYSSLCIKGATGSACSSLIQSLHLPAVTTPTISSLNILITMSPVLSTVALSARDEILIVPDAVTNFADAWPAETYVPIYDPGPAPPLAPWIAIAGCVLFFMICAMGIYICHRSANCPPWLMETLDDFAELRFRDANGDLDYPEERLPLNPKTYADFKACYLAKRRAAAALYKASPADKAMPSSTAASSVVDLTVKKQWDNRASLVSAAPSYKAAPSCRDVPSDREAPSNAEKAVPSYTTLPSYRHTPSYVPWLARKPCAPQPQPQTPRESKDAGAPLPPILRPTGSRW